MRAGSKKLSLAAIGLAAVIFFVYIVFGEAGNSNKPVRQVTLAGDVYNPPFAFEDDALYRGFTVNTMKAVAEVEGWEIKFVAMDREEAINALENGTIDGIQGMPTTPRLQGKFDFSDPYLVPKQRIFVNSKNETIHYFSDLKNARVAVPEVKTLEQVMTVAEWGLTDPIQGPDVHTALDMLAQNKVDAVLSSDLVGLYWEKEHSGGLIKAVGESVELQSYALAVDKGNTELLREFNDGLSKLSEDGTYEKIQERWFGQVVMGKQILSNFYTRGLLHAFGIVLLVGILAVAWNRLLVRRVRKSTADLAHKNEELHQLVEQVIKAFGQAVEVKDQYTKHHSDRVAYLARQLACEIGMAEDKCAAVFQAGLLHDIGKIGICEGILNKQSHLTPEEYQKIKDHPELGCVILADIPYCNEAGITEMIKQHHERWDGAGYPGGLKGEQIAFGARILALADAWDAMTSKRAYRPPMSVAKAISELQSGAGTQFDPDLVEPFIRCLAVGRKCESASGALGDNSAASLCSEVG